jgi:hypothetical protein
MDKEGREQGPVHYVEERNQRGYVLGSPAAKCLGLALHETSSSIRFLQARSYDRRSLFRFLPHCQSAQLPMCSSDEMYNIGAPNISISRIGSPWRSPDRFRPSIYANCHPAARPCRLCDAVRRRHQWPLQSGLTELWRGCSLVYHVLAADYRGTSCGVIDKVSAGDRNQRK